MMMALRSYSSYLTILIGLLAYLSYEFYFKIEYSPVVEITSGKIRGFTSTSRMGRKFYQFLGIPYAKALRFQSPQPADPWEGIRDVLHFGSKCVQVDSLTKTVVGLENCQYLNIFVPKDAFLKRKSLPVIFYIHGGFFMTGFSNFMGPEYLMDEDVILVTINYRLNVFGFLNAGTGESNFGLKDQRFGLEWLQQNIKQFSGNPDRVTIAGQSAGASAVHFNLLRHNENDKKNLFSAAIMSSGTAIKPWSLVKNPKEQAEHLAKKLNCPISTSSKLIECLKTKDAVDIARAHINSLSSPIMDSKNIFAPSIENGPEEADLFLTSHPYDILKSGKATNIPILTGINSDEGLLYTGRILSNVSLQADVINTWNELSPNFLVYNDSMTDLTAKIRNFYFGDDLNDKFKFKENFENVTRAFSDRLYIHAQRETVKIQSQFSPVYSYYFTYRLKKSLIYFSDINPDFPLIPQFVWKELKWYFEEYILRRHPKSLGVMHGDDVAMVFKFPIFNLSPGTKDFKMSRLMVKLWVDFATNHPTNQLSFNGKDWPPIRTSAKSQADEPLKYLLISNSNESGSLINEPFHERMKFWDQVNLPWK